MLLFAFAAPVCKYCHGLTWGGGWAAGWATGWGAGWGAGFTARVGFLVELGPSSSDSDMSERCGSCLARLLSRESVIICCAEAVAALVMMLGGVVVLL
jgi:hypothetical protein